MSVRVLFDPDGCCSTRTRRTSAGCRSGARSSTRSQFGLVPDDALRPRGRRAADRAGQAAARPVASCARRARRLRAQVRSAYQAYQATRYDAARHILPALIRGVETAARTVGSDGPVACAVRAHVYDITAALLSRVGEPFLAWAAADRAMFAAEQSGDPLLAAASTWRLSYMITGRKHPQEALELAMAAAAALKHMTGEPSPERLSVYGALHLAAATAVAASLDRETTESLLATARGIADRTGEANIMGTAFGPVNVAVHAISASLKLGDPRTATKTGEALDTTAMPVGLVGRRTQVNLDLARAYAMTRKDAAAVNLLLAAERLSPQLVRYDPATRDVLTELLRREHHPSTPELRPLARRAGVI